MTDPRFHASERSDWDAGRVLKTLVADLRSLRDERELRPDLLVFTGAAAFGGRGDLGICRSDRTAVERRLR